MAGALVTQTRVSNFLKTKTRPSQVVVDMACVSDDATGLVPTESMNGLENFLLTGILPIPDAVSPFTSACMIRIDDSDGNPVYKSESIAVDDVDPVSGIDTTGGYARMDAANTFKIVDPSDEESTISVGNAKEATFRLRFELRW